MEDKTLLEPYFVETFDEAKYQENLAQNGPFSDDPGIGDILNQEGGDE